MTSAIKAELGLSSLAACSSEAEAQFLVRRRLQSAGIPLGAWDTSEPERGVLLWRDDWGRAVRVFEWIDTGRR